MARTSLSALNDILFEQIERINDDDLHGDELKEQLDKSGQICAISSVIVKNAATMLRAFQMSNEFGTDISEVPVAITDRREGRLLANG